MKFLAATLAFLLVQSSAPANVDGEWNVNLTLPLGEVWFKMNIVQKGSELSGYMLNDSGQYTLKGTVNRDQVRIEWSYPDSGQVLPIVFTGTVSKNSMNGKAKVGTVGTGDMSASRQ